MTDATHAQPAGRSRGRKRVLLILLAVVAVLALVATGGVYAYAKQYDDRALPGTMLLGQDVSGKTPGEISALVADRAGEVQVTIDVDGTEHEASLDDLGVSVDADATGQAALSTDASIPTVISSAWSGERVVDPVVSVDESVLSSYASGLIPEDRAAPVDAEVVLDEETGEWSVSEGTSGQAVDAAALLASVESQAPALSSFHIDQPIEETEPAITTADAESALGEVEGILEQDMSITSPDGETHDVSADRRSSWLSVGPDEEGSALTVSVDEDSVREWVSERAGQSTVEMKSGIEQVDSDGEVVKVVSEGRDGVEVTNTDAVADELIAALGGGTSPFEATFESRTVEAETEQVDAPGDEGTGETGAGDSSGEKWIDVDLSAKTVTAYEGGTAVWGPRSMVDGKEGYETATGTYEIYLRNEVQDLTNANRYPEDHPKYYYTPDVPYVQYFHNGYAFHGAPWRSSFGYSGSHGCVNLTVADSKWLWEWADIGVRVESHW